MQRNEEKDSNNSSEISSKSAPQIVHQTGNVNVFVLGTAMVIAAMWLVFQSDATGTPTIAADHTSVQVEQSQHRIAVKNRSAMSAVMAEVIVTAPRLTEKSESYERPAEEVALVEPQAPKTFWQSPS